MQSDNAAKDQVRRVISLRALSVELDGAQILHGIDLTVEPGAWTSVIGPNGSGKTTLLRVVAGALPYSGEVSVAGAKPESMTSRELAKLVAYVPQNPVFPPEMGLNDYVLLGRTPYISYLGTESRLDRTRVEEVLEKVGLDRLARRRLGTLSGGEQQRALVARALAQEPAVLLLDEPTTGMDIGHQQQVLELVDTLRRETGLTVLSAIHDLTLAGQYSGTLLMIESGHTCALGTPREVLTEEIVLKYYGTPVQVLEDGQSGIVVIPLRNGAGADGHRLRDFESD